MKILKKILAVLLIILILFSAVKIKNKFSKIDGMDEVEEILNRAIEKSEEEKLEVERIPEPEIKLPHYEKEDKAIGKASKVKILAAGDIMYHMPQVKAAYDSKTKTYNFDDNYKYIETYVKEADLAIVNLETAVAGNELGFSGYPSFNAPVEILPSIKKAGFDLINYSNNHVLDKGKTGLIKSIKNIKDQGFDLIGSSDESGEKYLIREVNGIKIGFISYSYGFNGNEARYTREELDKFVNRIDDEKIRKDMDILKAEKVDFIVAYLHWGVEYSKDISKSQKELSNKLFSAGCHVIFGSHPHVIQAYSYNEKNQYVIYSMGNFISNQRNENLGNPNTEDGLMVELELSKDEYGNKSVGRIKHIPTWVNKYYTNKYNYEILPVEDVLNGQLQVYNFKAIQGKLKDSLERTNSKLLNKIENNNIGGS